MDEQHFGLLVDRIARESGCEYVVVIGAAALIPWHPGTADHVLTRTLDIDVILEADESVLNRIDFIFGEGSSFNETFGIYAQPVELETARFAPRQWVSRTGVFRFGAGTALCMEPHDLALSKYGAGREKDLEFNRALCRAGYVQQEELLARLEDVECDPAHRERMRARIKTDFRD